MLFFINVLILTTTECIDCKIQKITNFRYNKYIKNKDIYIYLHSI